MAGNALLTIQGPDGPSTTELWLQSIQTNSTLQFDDNQVKNGISYRPIRRAEQFIDFTAIWSLENFLQMDAFQDQLRQSQTLISVDQTPMQLIYPANDLVYYGWIEDVQKEYIRFQNVFVRFYRMNILLPDKTHKIAKETKSSGLATQDYAKMFGNNWYSITPTDPTSSQTKNPSSKKQSTSTPSNPGKESITVTPLINEILGIIIDADLKYLTNPLNWIAPF